MVRKRQVSMWVRALAALGVNCQAAPHHHKKYSRAKAEVRVVSMRLSELEERQRHYERVIKLLRPRRETL